MKIALVRQIWSRRFEDLAETSNWLRGRLRELNFQLIGEGAKPAPGAVTLAVPTHLNSVQIGQKLEDQGYLISYGSEYLRRRNWIQICLMGEFSRPTLVSLLALLQQVCSHPMANPIEVVVPNRELTPSISS